MGSAPERPLGPYNIVNLLQPRKRLDLHSVRFMQRNELVGLDIVEDKTLRDRGPVYFMGRIELTARNKACLSEHGRQRLCHDLSRRRSGMDVGHFFNGANFNVEVDVCGELFGEPLGLSSSSTFLIVARDSSTMDEHEFTVRSLHVRSYALSRVHISRWALFRTIKTIVEQNEQSPLAIRSPRWLTDKYLKANEQHFHDHNDKPSNTPRHVHRSEFYNLLARHRQWLTGKLGKEKLLDKRMWNEFLKEADNRHHILIGRQDGTPYDVDDLEQRWAEEDELIPENVEEPARRSPTQLVESAERNYMHTYHWVGTREIDLDEAEFRAEKASMVSPPDVIAAVPEALYSERPAFPTGSEWRCPVNSCDYVVSLLEAHGPNFAWMNEDDKRFLRSGRWGPDNLRAVELFYDMVERHFYEHLERAGIRHLVQRYVGKNVHNEPQYEFVELTGPDQTREEDICYKFEWINPHHH